MRARADEERIRRLVEELGRIAPSGTRIYLVGGATAVLEGWRASTVDVDLRIEPESDSVMRQIPALKERLQTNIEFGLVEPTKLREHFAAIEPDLFRFPALDARVFRAKLDAALR